MLQGYTFSKVSHQHKSTLFVLTGIILLFYTTFSAFPEPQTTSRPLSRIHLLQKQSNRTQEFSIFSVWLNDKSSFSRYEVSSLESLLLLNPNSKVVIFSNTLPAYYVSPYQKMGYQVISFF